MELKGKVALVTGAGRGLGEAHALALAAAGAKVVVNDVGVTAAGLALAQTVADSIVALGGIALADTSDISLWSSAASLVERTIAEFGEIDILVCNAGVCIPTRFGSLAEADWCRMMDVNVKGMVALIDAVTKQWQQTGPRAGRAIVCTASPAGAHPAPPLSLYGVTKAAVLAIAQVAAQELAPLGVRVNALAPIARTQMLAAAMSGRPVDLDRIMPCDPDYDLYDPAHVARLVLYLVSSLCPYTGRLFGVRADTIYVFEGWDAAHHIDNAGKAWTTETLAAALASVPRQEQTRIISSQGQFSSPCPHDATVNALDAVR